MRYFHCLIVLLLLSWTPCVLAEVVILQSGKSIEGEILLQNEDIVMLRDKEGRKFQFPRAEVVEITVPEQVVVTEQKAEKLNTGKGNCALRIDLAGGGLFVPSLGNGGAASVDLQIGTRQIGQRRIFLGGSVGYQAAITDKTSNFLPLMFVCSFPLISGKHAPELGTALGYGFAIKSPAKGGVTAKVDLSWRYQFSAASALLLGIQAHFQQAQVKFMEIVDEKEYYSTLGKNYVSLGLRLAIEF